MKKWFVVLCFSIVGTVAFAQVDPHAGERFLEQNKGRIAEEVSTNGGQLKLRDSHAAFERELAQSKVKASQISNSVGAAIERKVAQAMQAPHWPHWPHGDGLQDMAMTAPSDRPSYYAEEEAYKNCNGIEICRTWAAEQAQKDPHFQVLSAIISTPDYHNQHLEVTYVTENAEGKQVFAEDFGKWKKVN